MKFFYFPIFHEHNNSNLNLFSSISKNSNFRVLQAMIYLSNYNATINNCYFIVAIFFSAQVYIYVVQCANHGSSLLSSPLLSYLLLTIVVVFLKLLSSTAPTTYTALSSLLYYYFYYFSLLLLRLLYFYFSKQQLVSF